MILSSDEAGAFRPQKSEENSMTTAANTTSVETWHALSDDERQIEQAVLAGIHELFSNPTGDQRETMTR
jgi:hypothetical protein